MVELQRASEKYPESLAENRCEEAAEAREKNTWKEIGTALGAHRAGNVLYPHSPEWKDLINGAPYKWGIR